MNRKPAWDGLYTGRPSLVQRVVAVGITVVNAVLSPVGGLLRFTSLQFRFVTDGVPPFFLTRGLAVDRTDFEGMPVWSVTPPNATDNVIVAVHGGSYVGQASIFHWWTYAGMARNTGATVVVPLYALAPDGTAATEVPRTARFIADLVTGQRHDNVSVLGDSAGGGLALAATQHQVANGMPTPNRLVLLAPWLDVSMSDSRYGMVDDPLLDVRNLADAGRQWAGEAGAEDPMASPLFGSLAGLPPTYVYGASRDLLTVDILRLRDRVLGEGISNVDFTLRAGLIHGYATFPFLPDARAERANIYRDLLGAGAAPGASGPSNAA